jgi:AAA family ATP:ADP antiporter
VIQDVLADEARAQGIDTPSALLAFTRAETSAFYGSFYFWVNLSALVLQCFVASRLLKYGGFGVMLLFAPSVALITYSAMAWVPILAVVKAMKVVDNATDYSINNTARNVLWLPVAAITKLKAKPAIDSFFARAGDGFSALTVLIGVQILALGTGGFFAFTVALVVVWFSLAVVVVREHAKLVASQGEPPEGGVAEVRTASSAAATATAGGRA